MMRQALPYRPRFNAPPAAQRPTASLHRMHPGYRSAGRVASAGRSRGQLARIWWLVLGALVLALALVVRDLPAQRTVHAARAVRAEQGFDRALAVATADSAWSRIGHTYYDTTFHGQDWGAIGRTVRERAGRAHDMREVRAAIGEMFAALGESHFVLIPSDAVASWADAPVDGETLGDVGMEFRLLDGAIVVSRLAPDGPAALAGVHTGWTLTQLGDVEVAAFMRERLDVPAGPARRLAELQLPMSLMLHTQGSVGSTVRATFRDGEGRVRRVEAVRRAVPGEVVRFGHLPPQVVRFETQRYTDERGCVGVIRFNIWMIPVMAKLDDAMVEFQRCRGIVVDLRGNTGGVTAMLQGIGGYFVDSATSFGTMTTRAGAMHYVATPRRTDRRGASFTPFGRAVAIVMDGLSGSTSEMFAATMQAVGRARVFGEPSAGQALPAMLAKLPNGDVMQHVVGDFTTAAGRRIEAHGVTPDVRWPLRRAALLAGRDEAFQDALAWSGAGTVTTAALPSGAR